MIIKKFLHSCILIEDAGKRLLIDPGMFSFVEGKITPDDIGPVDVILLTHKHPDHFYPEALKKITALQLTEIVTHAEIGDLLEQEGFAYRPIQSGETVSVGGFTIRALTAPHGPLPIPLPHNLAYLINDRILIPGDSIEVAGAASPEILALPIAGPWARLPDSLAWARAIRPKQVIPIHDAIIKDFFLDRMYLMCADYFKQYGIAFHPLKLGESLEL